MGKDFFGGVTKPSRQLALRGERMFLKRKMKKRARLLRPWLSELNAAKLADNMATCSGPCCGNQRRYSGISLSEMRANDSFLAMMSEDDAG